MGSKSFRFDNKMEKELEFIQTVLKTTKTDAVKQALHLFYEKLQKKTEKQSPVESLKSSGLIGCFDGPSNLSKTYRKIMKDDLSKKYG